MYQPKLKIQKLQEFTNLNRVVRKKTNNQEREREIITLFGREMYSCKQQIIKVILRNRIILYHYILYNVIG